MHRFTLNTDTPIQSSLHSAARMFFVTVIIISTVVYADLIGSLFFKSQLKCSYTLDLGLSVTSFRKAIPNHTKVDEVHYYIFSQHTVLPLHRTYNLIT